MINRRELPYPLKPSANIPKDVESSLWIALEHLSCSLKTVGFPPAYIWKKPALLDRLATSRILWNLALYFHAGPSTSGIQLPLPADVQADAQALSDDGFGINVEHMSLTVRGTGEPSILTFANAKTGALVFPAELLKAHIPVRGASHADISFNGTEVDVVIGRRFDRELAEKADELPCRSEITLAESVT